jgi:GR25 family glycosyltransferase involved in LPS biosynthesis
MKTYIIRLSQSELSCNLAGDAFREAARLNYNPEYFEAITASGAESFLDQNHIKFREDLRVNERTLGTQGCFASHFSLWNKVVETNQTSVILEHDGVPIRDVEPLIDLVEDICHLDHFTPFINGNNDYQDTYQYKITNLHEHGVNTYINIRKFYPAEDLTGTTFRGAYGYLITPKGASKLIEFCRMHGGQPTDKAICEKAVHLQIANGTYVRLHSMFKTLLEQEIFSTRFGKNEFKLEPTSRPMPL